MTTPPNARSLDPSALTGAPHGGRVERAPQLRAPRVPRPTFSELAICLHRLAVCTRLYPEDAIAWLKRQVPLPFELAGLDLQAIDRMALPIWKPFVLRCFNELVAQDMAVELEDASGRVLFWCTELGYETHLKTAAAAADIFPAIGLRRRNPV